MRRLVGGALVGFPGRLVGRGRGRAEGAKEQNQLPALCFGEAFFEGRHGLMALTDFVEEFAVGDGVQVFDRRNSSERDRTGRHRGRRLCRCRRGNGRTCPGRRARVDERSASERCSGFLRCLAVSGTVHGLF